MNRALYCYFGKLDDHELSQPGHPLYQMFLLKSLAKKFNIDKFDIYYYNDGKFVSPKFTILGDYRHKIYSKLVNIDAIPFSEVMRGKYQKVFLKYRFRNYSRLKEGSLDRYEFEKIYELYKNKCCIIDTDAEVKEPYKHVVSLFKKDYKYPEGTKNVYKIVPVLKEDMIECVNQYFKEKNCFTFIGNQYFKVGITQLFNALKHYCPQLKIYVQGTWNMKGVIKIDRTKRVLGYTSMLKSMATVQISKEIYQKYDFLSPRIFEALLLGTICFGNNSYMPKFSKYKTELELSEKIKLLNELTDKEYYKILLTQIDELYDNIGDLK